MKQFRDRSPVLFAIFWIVLYVAGFSHADALSESLGVPKLLTVLLGLGMSGVLWGFVRKHRLEGYYGLRPAPKSA